MKPAGTHVAALALALVLAGCDAPKPESPAPPAEPAQATEPAPAPGVVKHIPPTGPAPFAVQLPSGKWCQGAADEIYFNGDDRICSVIRDIRADETLPAPHRRVTMKMTYHQPGPVTDDGETVNWSESDLRFNCDTGELWVMDITTYGLDGTVIQQEPQDPPRAFPSAPDMQAIVCGAEL